jgi:hypothetical protein
MTARFSGAGEQDPKKNPRLQRLQIDGIIFPSAPSLPKGEVEEKAVIAAHFSKP